MVNFIYWVGFGTGGVEKERIFLSRGHGGLSNYINYTR